jgi:hypothetical protein
MAIASGVVIDKKHTLLFDYVYDKSLKSNNTTDINAYKTDEWDKAWTYYSDVKTDEIIKKLKTTAVEKIVPKISLRDYGIYIGTHTIRNKEYAIAIYSRKGEIGNIKKVSVVEMKELASDGIKKHLYCGANILQKYVVLAFYEAGEKEPVLMIQSLGKEGTVPALPDADADLVAWMRYVGVMEGVVQLFNGNERFYENSVIQITAEPKMPQIRVKSVSAEGKEIELQLNIEYKRDGKQ